MTDRLPGASDIHFVPPEDVYKNREIYATLISRVLDGCYGDDYPGTSLKPDKNLQALSDRTVKSVFWAITPEELANEQFGTSSMYDAFEEFGPGFAEMGKSGSLGGKGAKLGYMRFMEEWEKKNSFLDGYNSLVTTVRNCPERPGKEHPIRAGAAIRVIFLKYLQFQQWGVAPWLLMPDDSDGTYEVLDLLFKFRDKEELIRYVHENDVVLNSPKARELLNKFLKFNLGIETQFKNTEENSAQSKEVKGWKILASSEKAEKNPIKLVRAKNEKTFSEAYQDLQEYSGAMSSIYIPLTNETRQIQQKLENDGWILTGFIPGIARGEETTPLQGMWSKLKTDRPFANPAYLKHPDDLSPAWYYEFVESTMQDLAQKQ